MSDEFINQDELDALFNMEGSDEETAKPDVHESKLKKFAEKAESEAPHDHDDGLVSQDELDSLFNLDDDGDQENTQREDSTGGNVVSQDELDSLFNLDDNETEQNETQAVNSSGGDMLSQDDLDALLNGASDNEIPQEPTEKLSAESSDSSGGDMLSQDDLDALLEGNSAEEAQTVRPPEMAASEDSGNGDILDQDELDALFSSEPAKEEKPVEKKKPAPPKKPEGKVTPDGGDILDQDELDALFSSEPAKEEKPVEKKKPAPPKEPEGKVIPDGGDILDQDELDALFSSEPAKEEKPVEKKKPAPPKKPEGKVIPDGGDILDQDELDALFSSEPAKEVKPVEKKKPAPPKEPEGKVIPDGGDILDQDELDALFSSEPAREEKPVGKKKTPAGTPPSSSTAGDDILSQDDLDSLFNLEEDKKPEPAKTPSTDDGDLVSQDELDLLLGGSSSPAKTEVKKETPPPVQQSKPADSKPKVLSQAEIDNMFAGLNLDDDDEEDSSSGDASVDEDRSSTSPATAVADYSESAPSPFYDSGGQSLMQKQYKLYNFRRPEKLSRDQIRLMKPHFEPMTRSVTNYLSMQLKTSIDTNFLDIDQINYGDIFRKLDQSDIIGIFKLYPTPHSGILEFSTFLFYSIEERMMGGSGKSHTPIRKITDFEKYLVTDLFENFLSAYGDTIRKFVDTNPRVDMVETDKFLIPRTLSDEEVLVRMVYEIYIDGVSGLLKINIPYSFLSTFFSPFRNKQEAMSDKIDSTSISKKIFSKISVPVSVELKPRKLSVGDLMSLRRGDTIILSHAYEEELGLKVDNNLKYYCKPGISGNKMAVKITRTAEGEEL